MLPKLCVVQIAKAPEHDLAVAKDILAEAKKIEIFADKAYIDTSWSKELAERNVKIVTPIKRVKEIRIL